MTMTPGRLAVLSTLSAFMAGAGLGGWYLRVPTVAASASYYQETMAPAVMFACGRGLVNPIFAEGALPEGASLRAFLSRAADTFDCRELPASIAETRMTPLQAASRYLQLALGLAWWIGGVSWSGLTWFYASVYGLVTALTYRALRLVMAAPWSTAFTVLVMTSPYQLGSLPHLRDYSKAPFFVALMAILLFLVRRPVPPRALVGWTIAAGVLMGVAFGFRFDMGVFFAFFLASVALFLPGDWRGHWRTRVVAVVAGVVAFLIVASPILLSFELGNNSWHVAILGFSPVHDVALKLGQPVYQFGASYNDSYVSAIVNGHHQLRHGGSQSLMLNTPEYGQAAADYFREIALRFPADLVVRAWAAAFETLRLPFESVPPAPAGVEPASWAATLWSGRASAMESVAAVGPWLAVAAILGLAGVDLRLCLLAASAVVLFGGMSSLQFQARHVFHLQVIGALLAGIALHQASVFAWQRVWRTQPEPAPAWRRPAFRIALVTAVLIAGAMGPVWALRRIQEPIVRALLLDYDRHLVLDDAVTRTAREDGTTLVSPAPAAPPGPGGLTSHLFAVDVGGPACDFDEVDMWIRYRAWETAADFSRPVHVRVPEQAAAVTRVWFSAYDLEATNRDEVYAFAGLQVTSAASDCLVRLGQLDSPAAVPLLVEATLPPGWGNTPLYKTFDRWSQRDVVRATHAWPDGEVFRRSELARPLVPLAAPPPIIAPIARSDSAGRLIVNGRAASSSAYLASWPPTSERTGSLLVAEGTLEDGGLSVGLEEAGGWVAQVAVTTPGPFRVVIRAPADAVLTPVVANNRPGRLRRTQFTVDRIGWIR